MKKSNVLFILLIPALILAWAFLTISLPYLDVLMGGLAIIGTAGMIWMIKDEDRETQWIVILCALGFLLKLCYILYTPISIRQHDVHSFTEDQNGHSAYIRYLLDNRHLPDFDPRTVFQFYHPPLHHIFAAVWVQINRMIGVETEQCWRNIQILTLFYMGVSQIVMASILQELRFHGKALFFPLLLFCFHPFPIFLSGSINNDALSVLFILLIVWMSLCWNRDPSWKHTILLAVFYGLGMSVKLSVGYLAPATAVLFLWKLMTEKAWAKKILPKLLIFAVIAFPLGLWWYVRNAVLFHVPIAYVPQLSQNTTQYLGENYTVFERFLDFNSEQLDYLYISFGHNGDYQEHNILMALIKTSVFEEQTLTRYMSYVKPVSYALLFFNMILIGFSLIGQALCLKRLKAEESSFMAAMYLVSLISFFLFCFAYPHVCTQNYRYIFPTLIFGLIGIGALMEHKAARGLTMTFSVLFCIASAAQFIMLGM